MQATRGDHACLHVLIIFRLSFCDMYSPVVMQVVAKYMWSYVTPWFRNDVDFVTHAEKNVNGSHIGVASRSPPERFPTIHTWGPMGSHWKSYGIITPKKKAYIRKGRKRWKLSGEQQIDNLLSHTRVRKVLSSRTTGNSNQQTLGHPPSSQSNVFLSSGVLHPMFHCRRNVWVRACDRLKRAHWSTRMSTNRTKTPKW